MHDYLLSVALMVGVYMMVKLAIEVADVVSSSDSEYSMPYRFTVGVASLAGFGFIVFVMFRIAMMDLVSLPTIAG